MSTFLCDSTVADSCVSAAANAQYIAVRIPCGSTSSTELPTDAIAADVLSSSIPVLRDGLRGVQVALPLTHSNRTEIRPKSTAIGISPNTAVAILRSRQRPLCAVTTSNQTSHRSRTLVTIDATTAICLCFQIAQAVEPIHPNKMMSKPVPATGHLPTR